jgi:acetyltransferase
MNEKLNSIFNPKTIAVIGASNTPHTIGYALVNNLIGKGYRGTVYPVNPKEHSIQGVRCYRQVGDIADPVDLAIISIPAPRVAAVVRECGEAGVAGAVIISAGFTESGEEGIAMSEDVKNVARAYDLRIVGPNCLGFINPHIKLNASFANTTARPGKIAFISQSGALCTSILQWARDQNVGFSYFVSIGDMIDVGFHDLIDYFGNDARTSSILIYMESLKDARRFMSAARAFARSKPILVLKAGKSKEGAKATFSHTGSLAGNDAVFEAALKRAGVIRVDTIAQLFNCAQALALQKRPRGNCLAIITNAGGPGVLATDHLIDRGGCLAKLTPESIEKLKEVLPANWSRGNPVDILGDATAERYRQAAQICIDDPNVDGILVIYTPQAITQLPSVEKEIVQVAARTSKTVLASWMVDSSYQHQNWSGLTESHIPTYTFPESAVDVFLKMYNYSRNIELLYETPSTVPQSFTPQIEPARRLLDQAVADGRQQLTEIEAKELLRFYDLPVTDSQLTTSAEEAVQVARQMGYPVVLKIVSPDIGLKTDIGGVMLNLENDQDVQVGYEYIMNRVGKERPEARIYGISVEKMIFKRYELLIGSNKDPIFGPVIVFGMGGVTVEVFKDSSIGLPPLNMALSKHIIEETKVYKLLQGFRGMPEIDVKAIQFLLFKFAYLVMDCPQIREIDINPLVVDEAGGIILDAYVVLDREFKPDPRRPYAHLVISPYPKQYVRTYALSNGKEVLLRPIRPEDEPLEKEMIARFSRQTQYFRYFGYLSQISKDLLKRSTQIDYDREIAIVAEIAEEGRASIIGEVRLLAEANNEMAEFAIAVADPWQGLGLGNEFTDYVIEIARERGIGRIYANVLKANRVMVHMFRSRGFELKSLDFTTYFAELKIEHGKLSMEN